MANVWKKLKQMPNEKGWKGRVRGLNSENCGRNYSELEE